MHTEHRVPANISRAGDKTKCGKRPQLFGSEFLEQIFSCFSVLAPEMPRGYQRTKYSRPHPERGRFCLVRSALSLSNLGQTCNQISVEECPEECRSEEL